MTMPNDEPGFILRMILDKVNAIDTKIDGHSEKLVSHEVRLTSVEKKLDSSWKTRAALVAALVGAAAGPVVSLIIK